MKVLDLFSGIGGFSLGLERAGFQTVAFCEIEKFPRAVLRKHWSDIPIYDDIRTLTADRLRSDGIGAIDVICGGFPCQSFSVAGRRAGTEDNRYLWPEMFRIIQECQPTWVIGENVTGFIDMAFERTAIDLESEGYEVQAIIIPACAIGAPHRRDRVWIIAHSTSSMQCRNKSRILCKQGSSTTQNWGENLRQQDGATSTEFSAAICENGVVAYPDCERCRQGGDNREKRHVQDEQIGSAKENKPEWHRWEFRAGEDYSFPSWREIEPTVCRGDNGVSPGLDKHRATRIKALGNAAVPQITEIIGRAIMEQYETNP